MMIYIRPNVIHTGLCFVCLLFYFAILHVYTVCLYSDCFTLRLKNFTTTTTTYHYYRQDTRKAYAGI